MKLHKMNNQGHFINTALLFALSLGYASAANITTYNRSGFDAAVAGGSTTTQTFDTLAPGTILSTLNGVTYGASAGKPVISNSFATTSGLNSLASTSDGFFAESETATFTFATAITAFGIDINTFGALSGDYLAATTNLGNVALSDFDPFAGLATGQFVGFTSDTPFTTVTIRGLTDASGNLYPYTLDTMVYGTQATSAPEPATLAAFGLGLAVIGLVKAKRKHA